MQRKSRQMTLADAVKETVRALHAGRLGHARQLIGDIERSVPDHPSIVELKRAAAVMGFSWPAQRTTYDPLAVVTPDPATVDIVVFHVARPAAPIAIHEDIDYLATLRLAFESAALRAPAARRILLTDEATEFPRDLPVHEVLRFPLDPSRTMYERMRVQRRYLEERGATRCSVLMDADVLVNCDPAGVFAEDFDVGLTWREDWEGAPFNGGMIYVAAGRGGARYFDAAVACYERIADDSGIAPLFPSDLRNWWGDQFALAAVVGHQAFLKGGRKGLAVDGVKVRFFPCAEYNSTLDPGSTYGIDAIRAMRFLHFKGKRKRLMQEFLNHMRNGII
jgi:hypothetical protein